MCVGVWVCAGPTWGMPSGRWTGHLLVVLFPFPFSWGSREKREGEKNVALLDEKKAMFAWVCG